MINPAKARYQQRKTSGLCVKCGKPRGPEYVVCWKCAGQQRLRWQKKEIPDPQNIDQLEATVRSLKSDAGITVYYVPPGFTGENLSAFKKALKEKSQNGHATRWGKPNDA